LFWFENKFDFCLKALHLCICWFVYIHSSSYHVWYYSILWRI